MRVGDDGVAGIDAVGEDFVDGRVEVGWAHAEMARRGELGIEVDEERG